MRHLSIGAPAGDINICMIEDGDAASSISPECIFSPSASVSDAKQRDIKIADPTVNIVICPIRPKMYLIPLATFKPSVRVGRARSVPMPSESLNWFSLINQPVVLW